MKSVKLKRIYLFIFFFISTAFTQPKIALDFTFSRYSNIWYIEYPTSAWGKEIFLDSYYGFKGELLFSFIKNLYFRTEVIQCVKYDQSGGGGLSFFGNPGIDIIYSIPLRWKVTPVVFLGIQYTRYFNLSDNDKRKYTNPCKIDAGLGAQYALPKNFKLYTEIQLYENFVSDVRRVPNTDALIFTSLSGINLGQFNIGLRKEF